MIEVLRNKTPVARKEHRCEFCGEVIHVGEKYNRQSNVYDGRIYDWVSHCVCSKLAYELDMFDDCDEGLDGDGFVDRLNQYVYDKQNCLDANSPFTEQPKIRYSLPKM